MNNKTSVVVHVASKYLVGIDYTKVSQFVRDRGLVPSDQTVEVNEIGHEAPLGRIQSSVDIKYFRNRYGVPTGDGLFDSLKRLSTNRFKQPEEIFLLNEKRTKSEWGHGGRLEYLPSHEINETTEQYRDRMKREFPNLKIITCDIQSLLNDE